MPKPRQNDYFGEVEEKAVVDYINAQSEQERNEIYSKYLHEPIWRLVNSIILRYRKYIGNCGLEELVARAYMHTFESIKGFQPDRIGKTGQKVKAYSYLGTICHNYYKNHSEMAYKHESTNDDIHKFNPEYIDSQIKDHYRPNTVDEPKDVTEVVFESIIKKIEEELETNKKLKVIEIKVGESLVYIFKNYKSIFIEDEANYRIEYTKRGKPKKPKHTNIYNKNKIFYCLKELTNLSSKDIRTSLIPFKSMYWINKVEVIKEY